MAFSMCNMGLYPGCYCQGGPSAASQVICCSFACPVNKNLVPPPGIWFGGGKKLDSGTAPTRLWLWPCKRVGRCALYRIPSPTSLFRFTRHSDLQPFGRAKTGLANARLPAEKRVEHVLMAVTLAAARRLGALHHRLKPTGHIHLQHFVAPNETMLL
ncbi:hypothetical protein XENOCAPTIV_009257 [Xenoophorus captivus]|uniref:Uncharacterized protein n=1 Tax=Xenoophorus captivus TaxID=1517983 RepID=A0ABV0QQT9_9TELE